MSISFEFTCYMLKFDNPSVPPAFNKQYRVANHDFPRLWCKLGHFIKRRGLWTRFNTIKNAFIKPFHGVSKMFNGPASQWTCSTRLHLSSPFSTGCVNIIAYILQFGGLLGIVCFFFFVRLLICNWFNGYICVSVQVAAAIDMADLQAWLQSNRRPFLKRHKGIIYSFYLKDWSGAADYGQTISTSQWNKSSL